MFAMRIILFFLGYQIHVSSGQDEYPSPHVVIVGPTGAGRVHWPMLYWVVIHKRMAACLESVGEWILAPKIQPSGQALGWVAWILSRLDLIQKILLFFS